MIIDEKIIMALKERYKYLHPLLFHRSLERSKTPGELFDILDTIPDKFPIVWSDENRKWETTKDLFQSKNFSVK